MYKQNPIRKTDLQINKSYEGKTIEEQIESALNNGEKLEGNNQLLYTEKNEGVIAGYNIRTDRFEVALETFEKMEKSRTAKREAMLKIVKDEEDGGPSSVADTNKN